MTRRHSTELTVIKIGGGLTAVPGALDRVCTAVTAAACDHRILVVPGGGPFADAVRRFDRSFGLSPDAAHWMAILAMDQYAHVLVHRMPGALLIEEPGAVFERLKPGCVTVLAPSRWMRSADVLPHNWEVSSDSIAAFVAGALDAARLILIKPSSNLPEPVDPYFARALPVGMPHSVIGCDRMDQLPGSITDRQTGAGAGP
jgi:5-(aminomethyl)-3-furanmethanol phosphate kinase